MQRKTFESTTNMVIADMENSVISTMRIRNVNLKTVIIKNVVIDIPCHADISKLERIADISKLERFAW